MTSPLLNIQGLTKAYPGVIANNNVSFDIDEGQLHALLGENGAGKSTLVKMIYGLVKPDSGTMLLRGRPYAPPEPRAARIDGIATPCTKTAPSIRTVVSRDRNQRP